MQAVLDPAPAPQPSRFFHPVLALALLTVSLFVSGCATSPELGMLTDRDKAGHKIVVHLETQKAYLYKNGTVVGISPVSTGREGYNTPAGHYAVLAKDIDHRSSVYGTYYKDGRVIKAGVNVKKDPKPPGATYVGAPMFYYLQIAPAYGLHAGELPGYAASHGCIRLPPAWAKRFYYASKVGTPVIITR